MADISNLKINERANVKRPNLRELLLENEIYIKGQYENRHNCEWFGNIEGTNSSRNIEKLAIFQIAIID